MQAEKSVDTPGDRENFISQGFGGDNGKFLFHGVQEAAGSNPVTRTKGKSLWDLPFYFVNNHFLLHGNMQLLAVERLYVEVLFYI